MRRVDPHGLHGLPNHAASVAELVERGFAAKGLASGQLDLVVNGLPSLGPASISKALDLLGYAADLRHRPVLESYLHDSSHPALAAMALRALSHGFGLSTRYLAYARDALAGISWDVADDVLAEALVTAGRILRVEPDHHDLALRIHSELITMDSPLRAHAAGAASLALGLTSADRARSPLGGSAKLAERFRDTFVVRWPG